ARADAAVVDLHVQALAVVHGGAHRADEFAGRVLAVHAGHRLEGRLAALRQLVGVDADPVHLAPAGDLLLAHHRDVVLRLAGCGAGVAADAGVQVDAHRPGVAARGPVRVERWVFGFGLQALPGRQHAHRLAAGRVQRVLR